MSKVLYNKYRSQDFDQLIGQEHITKILKNAVKKDKVSHAYLFVGSRGTGKTSTARILSKAINCANLTKEGNPCNECDQCKAISSGYFMDLIEIDAASNRGIDQIRELKEKIEFSPSEGKYKVYIIDEVHMLTKEAFNALLKTLEEPPAHVVFMLATTDVHKLPPTILSRCQRYDFRLGTDDDIRNVLKRVSKEEGVILKEDALKLLSEAAKGSYRDSLSLLDVVISGQLGSEKPEEITEAEVRKILGIPDSTMVYVFLESIVKKDKMKALAVVSELESKGVNMQQFVAHVLGVLREILVKKIQGKLDPKEYSFAKDMTEKEISEHINIFLNVERNIKNSSIPVLAFEVVIAEMEGKATATEPVKKPQEGEEVEETEEEEPVDIEEEDVDTNLDIEEVKKKWDRVIEGVKPANGHLFAFLRGAKLLDLSNGLLKLEVPFEFHKDRIETIKSKGVINDVMEKIFGSKVKIECIVNGGVRKRRPVSADVVMKDIPKSTHVASEQSKPTYERKVNPQVEEIFAGM